MSITAFERDAQKGRFLNLNVRCAPAAQRALHAQQAHGPHRRRDRDAGRDRFKQQPRVDHAEAHAAGIWPKPGADKPRAVR